MLRSGRSCRQRGCFLAGTMSAQSPLEVRPMPSRWFRLILLVLILIPSFELTFESIPPLPHNLFNNADNRLEPIWPTPPCPQVTVTCDQSASGISA